MSGEPSIVPAVSPTLGLYLCSMTISRPAGKVWRRIVRRLQRPVRREMMLDALADVVIVGRRQMRVDQFPLPGGRQSVESLPRRCELRLQRQAQPPQALADIDAIGESLLLDLRGHLAAVSNGVKIEEVLGILGGNREIRIEPVPDDVRHGKGDEADDVVMRRVEEAIADADLLLRDEEILGAHLDIGGLGEGEAARPQFGDGVVGRGRADGGKPASRRQDCKICAHGPPRASCRPRSSTHYRPGKWRTEALLLGQIGGEFALPDPLGQKLGETGGMRLAIGGDELAKGGADRRVREGFHVDPIEHRLGEGLADIAERGPARVGGREFAQGLSEGGKHDAASLLRTAAHRDPPL